MNNININELRIRILELESQLSEEFGCRIELALKNINGIPENTTFSRNKVLNAVIEAACSYSKHSQKEIFEKNKCAEFTDIRHVCFAIAREFNPHITYVQLGLKFGGRDYSTVIHGIRRVKERVKLYPEYKNLYNQIKIETWKQLNYQL